VVFIWIIQPIGHAIYDLFFIEENIVGETQNINFSTIPFIPVYCPTITFKGNTYMCSYLDNVQDNHKASFVRPLPNDRDNISDYIPFENQKYVLSIVKYYGDEVCIDRAEQGMLKGIIIPPPMPIQDAMLMNRIELAPDFAFVDKKKDKTISQQPVSSSSQEEQQLPSQLLQPTPTVFIIPQELSQKINEQTISNDNRRNQNKTRRPEHKSRRIIRSREVEGYGYAPLPATLARVSSSAIPLLPLNKKVSNSSSIHPLVMNNDSNYHLNDDNVAAGGSGVDEELKDPGRIALKPNRVLLKPLQHA